MILGCMWQHCVSLYFQVFVFDRIKYSSKSLVAYDYNDSHVELN